MNENLYNLIRSRISDLERIAIDAGPAGTCSYDELDRRSARIAQALVDSGVSPGDRVAVQVEKSTEAVLLYLACLRAGAVYLPLNSGYTASELTYFLEDSEPRLAVCDPRNEAAFRDLAAQTGVGVVETLDAAGQGSLAARAAAAPPYQGTLQRASDDLAAILYTSGTTGRAKGAMLTHGNLTSNALTLIEAWQFSENDLLLHALPIFHAHGLFVAINVILLSGGSMLFLPRFDVAAVLALLPRATTMMGVPTFFSRLLAAPAFTAELVAHMRVFISGSAPLSPEAHKAFEARCGHAILERYGMTETLMNSSNPYVGARRPGSVGFPLPGVEIRITDRESGALLPDGEVGSVEIRGPNVFKGYWRMPEKTAAEFRDDGFFVSGDLGRFDEEGYLALVGRGKDLIITGGFNVYPAEVEAALDALEGIAESAVIGLPHADFGEAVTAVVVLSGERPRAEAEVRKSLEVTLAKYKVPKRVFAVESLPRNAMGKVQKNQLRATYAKTFA